MDTFSIIQGIHFSRSSDAGKTYYIINTLYNAINIWCHKSASCLLGLLANGVWVLQSNRTSFIRLQQGRGVNICFPLTVENTSRTQLSFRFTVYESFTSLSLSHTLRKHNVCFFKNPMTKAFLSFFLSFSPSSLLCYFYAIKPPLYIAGLVQDSLPLLLQSLDNQFTLTWPG